MMGSGVRVPSAAPLLHIVVNEIRTFERPEIHKSITFISSVYHNSVDFWVDISYNYGI